MFRKVLNKSSVKVCKSKECLNLFNSNRCWPIKNSCHLGWVHLDDAMGYNSSQIFNFFFEEKTFFRFCKQIVLFKASKYDFCEFQILLYRHCEDENVIQVHLNSSSLN